VRSVAPWWVAVFASAFVAIFGQSASAFDAQLAWAPVAGATGYRVYVTDVPENAAAAALLATKPGVQPNAAAIDAGQPAVDADGLVRYILRDVPFSAAGAFWVVAYDERGSESPRSNVMLLTETTVARVVGGGDALAADSN